MSQWFHNTHTHWPHDVNSLLSDHIYSCGLSGVQNKQRRLRGECLKLEKLRTSSVPTTKLRSSREQTADLPPQQHVRPVFKYSSCISEADRASRRIWLRPEALCSQNIGDSFLGEGRRSKVEGHPPWMRWGSGLPRWRSLQLPVQRSLRWCGSSLSAGNTQMLWSHHTSEHSGNVRRRRNNLNYRIKALTWSDKLILLSHTEQNIIFNTCSTFDKT